MKPSEVSKELTRIASQIEASKNPRPELVAADIKKILASLSEKPAEKK